MTRATPRYRGPNTWALAREAYLAGETARSVAARLDLGFHGLKMRMRREGWTRRAVALATDASVPQAAPWRAAPGHGGTARPRPSAPAAAAEPAAETTAPELLRRALRQAAEALDEGRVADARALSQMAESLSRTAAREPKTSLETILRALRDSTFRGELFRIDPDAADDPDLPTKRAYWGLPGAAG